MHYVRAPVPTDIVATFGKREITYSLHTKDAAEARRLVEVEATKIRAQFEAHRQTGKPATKTRPDSPLSPAVLLEMGNEFYLQVIDDEYAWRSEVRAKVVADPEGFLNGDYIPHPTDDWYTTFFDQMTADESFLCCVRAVQAARLADSELKYAVADITPYTVEATAMASRANLALPGRQLQRLARKLLEIEIDARKAIIEKDTRRYEAVLAARAVVVPAAIIAGPTAVPDPGPLLSSLVSSFLDEGKKQGLVKKTSRGDASDLREFLDVLGDKAIRAYTKADGVTFKDTLVACPSQRKIAPFAALNIVEAAKKADAQDPGRKTIARLHITTINDKLNAISKFFVWANNHVEGVANPVEGLRIKHNRRRGKTVERRLPFDLDELVKLFNGPIYRGCKSMTRWKEPGDLVPRESARFWAPLIALYSGMRMGEIIQLRTSDIKTDGGITYFAVTASTEADDGEAEKSLKTATSNRNIPVHPFLIQCGLMDLVAQRVKEGTPRLLPDYDRSPTDDSWSKTFSAWFQDYRKHVGVERIFGGKNRVDFHSFRHLFEDVLRRLPNVKKEFRDAIQGHSETGTSAGYGIGVPLSLLNGVIEQVKHEGLDLSHLVRPMTPSD